MRHRRLGPVRAKHTIDSPVDPSLVDAEWGVSATNRRVRIYRITRAGTKHLGHEVSSFERMLEGITLVLALADR